MAAALPGTSQVGARHAPLMAGERATALATALPYLTYRLKTVWDDSHGAPGLRYQIRSRRQAGAANRAETVYTLPRTVPVWLPDQQSGDEAWDTLSAFVTAAGSDGRSTAVFVGEAQYALKVHSFIFL